MSVYININGNNSLDTIPITIGDNNVIILQGLKDEINWKMIQDELMDASDKLSKKNSEYAVTKKAFSYALQEDKEGLTNFLKLNAACFLSDVFKGVASGTLVEIIKLFLFQ